MPSRYIDSVPILLRRAIVSGYIWQILPSAGPCEPITEQMAVAAGAIWVGVLPDGIVLLATAEPVRPNLPVAAAPWPLRMFNDDAQSVPLAFIDDTGRYVQLESFSASLEDEPADQPANASADSTPTFCSFLVAQSNSQVHVCAD